MKSTTTQPTDPHLAALRRRWPWLDWRVERDHGQIVGYREATTRIRVRPAFYSVPWVSDRNRTRAWVADFNRADVWGRTPVEAASRAIRAAVREARRTLAALAPDGKEAQ